MKKLIIIGVICLFTQTLFAQYIWYVDPADKFGAFEIEKVFVKLTGDKEMDEALKYGFENYWKQSPFELVAPKEFKNSSKWSFEIESYTFNDAGSYRFTGMGLYQLKKGKKIDYNVIFSLNFDNFSNVKTKQLNGIDKDNHMLSNKIIQYIILLNQQLAKRKELGVKKYIYLNNKDKVKDVNLLIPKEYFDNGLSESVLKENYKGKYTILTSDEIKKRIMDKKDLENCAELIIWEDQETHGAFIMDLNTGDLLSYAKEGKFNMNPGKKITDGDFKTLIKKLQ